MSSKTKNEFLYMVCFGALILMFFFLPIYNIGAQWIENINTLLGSDAAIEMKFTVFELKSLFSDLSFIIEALEELGIKVVSSKLIDIFNLALWAMPISLGFSLLLYFLDRKILSKFFAVLAVLINIVCLVAIVFVMRELKQYVANEYGSELLDFVFEMNKLIFVYFGTLFIAFIVSCKLHTSKL